MILPMPMGIWISGSQSRPRFCQNGDVRVLRQPPGEGAPRRASNNDDVVVPCSAICLSYFRSTTVFNSSARHFP